MKRFFDSAKFFASMLLVGCTFGLASCSDDDEPQIPDEVTTDAMFGNYTGKMTLLNMNPLEGEEADGVDISAEIDNDTVYFEKFPIRDIVLSIVKDEALTDRIVEAVGDIDYKVGYNPSLTADKDSVMFAMNPEPLKLSVPMPSETEGEETQALQIEVKIDADREAAYAVETGNARFGLAATEVLLGEGEEQAPLPDFKATNLNFNMNQSKVSPHRP